MKQEILMLVSGYANAYYNCSPPIDEDTEYLYDRAYVHSYQNELSEWVMSSQSTEDLALEIIAHKERVRKNKMRCLRNRELFSKALMLLNAYEQALVNDYYKYNQWHPDLYAILERLYDLIWHMKDHELKKQLATWKKEHAKFNIEAPKEKSKKSQARVPEIHSSIYNDQLARMEAEFKIQYEEMKKMREKGAS